MCFWCQSNRKTGYKWHTCRCQPSRNRVGNPAFRLSSRIPAFLQKRTACLAIFRKKIKFLENRENCQHQEDTLWTMRKCPRRAPAMFSTPGDQKVHVNMIVKAPHSTIWRKNASISVCICASIYVREDANIASHIFFLFMLTPMK